MGRGELVAAFIEVATGMLTVEALEGASEEGGDGQQERQFPLEMSFLKGQDAAAERRPAADGFEDFLGCMLAMRTLLATADEQAPRAVAFDVVVDVFAFGLEEQLAAGVFPSLSVVALGQGPDAALLYMEVKEDGIAAMGHAESHHRLIGKAVCPVVCIHGQPFHALPVEKDGDVGRTFRMRASLDFHVHDWLKLEEFNR